MKDDEQRTSDKVWLTAGETWQESSDIVQQWEEWDRMGWHHCKTVLHVQTPNTVLLCFGLLHSCDSPLYACRYSLVLQRYVVISKHSNCSVKFIGLPVNYPYLNSQINIVQVFQKVADLNWRCSYKWPTKSQTILYSVGPFESENKSPPVLVSTDTDIWLSQQMVVVNHRQHYGCGN